MSATLEIYADHNLKFSNYFEGIALIEKQLEIIIGNRKNFENINSKEEYFQVFTNHEFFSKKFDESQEIYLMTDLDICPNVVINRYFIKFNFGGRFNSKYHLWEKFVSKFNYNELNFEEKQKYDEVLAEWNELRSYVKLLAKKLGGKMIFYFSDGADFTLAKDKILDNSTLDEFTEQLNLLNKSTKFTDLEKGKVDFSKQNNWYLDII